MAIEVRIPTLGESVTEGVIVRWIKQEGEAVSVDDPLLELETDKANVEIPAEQGGTLQIVKQEGETVQVGDVIAKITDGPPTQVATTKPVSIEPDQAEAETVEEVPLSPAVRRLVEEKQLDPAEIPASGKGGRLTKGDVLAFLEGNQPSPPSQPSGAKRQPETPINPPSLAGSFSEATRTPMTRIRLRIADRLVEAQQTAAILTTFNEVDMSEVMALRKRHKERFAEVHGVGLGFMSFFARACVGAMRKVPIVNARIDGSDILQPENINLGVAVSAERGLVVPVVKKVEQLSFAEIEAEIARLADAARSSKLSIDDLSGGTFSLSNGGVFGSLMSAPILNPPQSAILGMHKIEKRPIVIDDQVVIRPMMYLALSYDHRLIDGEQAVTFLVRVKEGIEDPSRLLLEI